MRDRFVEVAGCNVRYRDSGGEGPAIVFIHGIGGSLEFWTEQQSLAAHGYRVIAVDLPGHGLSAMGDQVYCPNRFAAFCSMFLDAIGTDRVILVGNSMGGAIAIRMAKDQPQRVLKLFLANAATLGRFSPFPFRLMTLPILGALLTKPSKAVLKQQLDAIFYRPEKVVTPQLRKVIERNVMNVGRQRAFLSTIRKMNDLGGQRQSIIDESISALQSLDLPVTFLHGHQDVVLPVSHSVEAQRLTANSSLIVFENCGHTPQVEKPAEFNQALLTALSK